MSLKDIDSHKLGYHPERVAEWMRYKKCMPLHAEIGLTNACNHRCEFCTLDWITHGKDFLDFETLESVLYDMEKIGIKSIYYAGEGEPTLHRHFSDIIRITKQYGMSVAVSTNGTRCTSEIAERTLHDLSWIRFSLDTINEFVYEKLHGVSCGTLKKVLENIESCVEIKKTLNLKVDIGVQVISTKETLSNLISLVLYMRNIGVDNVQIKPCHSHPQSSYKADPLVISYESLRKDLISTETEKFKVIFRTRSMERLLESRTYKDCHGFNFYTLINAKGDVVPCNIFYDKKDFIYGNIYDNRFEEIWTRKRRCDINKKITESNFSMCGDYRCRQDVMNRYLERVQNPELNDEFI